MSNSERHRFGFEACLRPKENLCSTASSSPKARSIPINWENACAFPHPQSSEPAHPFHSSEPDSDSTPPRLPPPLTLPWVGTEACAYQVPELPSSRSRTLSKES